MWKIRSGWIMLSAIALLSPSPALQAQSCTAGSSCPPPPLQVIPGQLVRVEVINRTPIPIQIEQLYATGPMYLNPGEISPLLFGNTIRNFSLIFWEPTGRKLFANVFQPEEQVLRIEILPGGEIEGEGAVYLRNDGRIDVF
ncbi:hypothetical protein [Spirulina subsalsa]|uniref:hypothetical protein n=1 Tax=Spirulina subsalsa TaxID=54311 RepID=UPI00037E1A82|nr:hypothetical protein [Spirulina subsalsa]